MWFSSYVSRQRDKQTDKQTYSSQYRAPGHRLANAALLSMVPEPETDYTASPPTAGTVAIFIQAPSQDPHGSSSSLVMCCHGCSCVSYIPSSGAVVTVVSSAQTTKGPDSTQLNLNDMAKLVVWRLGSCLANEAILHELKTTPSYLLNKFPTLSKVKNETNILNGSKL